MFVSTSVPIRMEIEWKKRIICFWGFGVLLLLWVIVVLVLIVVGVFGGVLVLGFHWII